MAAYESPAVERTLADATLQRTLYTATARSIAKRKNALPPGIEPEFQEFRALAHEIKRHTLEHLDHYLEEAERNVIAHGGHVIWARDADDVVREVLAIARRHGARLLVKSKSMTTEEIDFNSRLQGEELEVVETDLGEFIIQLSGERPFHIVAPALHKSRYEVADLFEAKLGGPRTDVPEEQTQIARRVLREKFLAAGIGISGANFVVADSGAAVIVENEGNARLSTSAPRVHIAIAGIEKLIPRLADLGVFLYLLGRSGTGQPLTVYTSMLSGPRAPSHLDGPEEFYLVLLDNGRSRLLADQEKRESLFCIRCGACLHHCPVYRKIGGHNYPGTYSGPIGAILTPQFHGVVEHPWLPHASSLCGACAEVCPVKIDIPKVLLSLRAEVAEKTADEPRSRWERRAMRLWAWLMHHPVLFDMAGRIGSVLMPDGSALMARFGPLAAWARGRELPRPAPKSFRQLWAERRREELE
jgi:L-lactate dehydrogenase complex protein LldF